MRPVPIVASEPDRQLCGAAVGVGIGPFAKRGLDEALGLSVGARRIGPGPSYL
jgi:hypothetical protein